MTSAPTWDAPPAAPPWARTEPTAVASLVVAVITLLAVPVGLAAAALLAAVVGFGSSPGAAVFLLLVLGGAATAVVLGHVARSRCRREGSAGAGIAAAGLSIGYVMLAGIALTATAFALPAGDVETSAVATGHGTFAIPAPVPPGGDGPTSRGVLSGLVVDERGALVAGAAVLVRRHTPGDRSDAPTCPVELRATSGSDGRWFLPACKLGSGLGYDVTVSKDGRRHTTRDVYVTTGQSTPLQAQLPRAR